jgi:hypothetical protein
MRTASIIVMKLHRPDDGGSTHFRNVILFQPDYTALYPRRLSPSRTWSVKKKRIHNTEVFRFLRVSLHAVFATLFTRQQNNKHLDLTFPTNDVLLETHEPSLYTPVSRDKIATEIY